MDLNLLPPPGWHPTTAGYWLAAEQRQLAIQQCRACGVHRWPPTPVCYSCHSTELDWDVLPGTGTVFTYTWVTRAAARELDVLGVYNIAIISVDGVKGEDVRLHGRVLDVEIGELVCGMPVVVDFEPFSDGVNLPVWRPAP
ncbi:MAG: hypothetical protein JWO77_3817 [Ilumatobacteraceae bacterium]|nr:hypothetical protein [Ilumatobacteraceae bacterium]